MTQNEVILKTTRLFLLRNDHKSTECPNCDAEFTMHNNDYKVHQANNVEYDKQHPDVKIRVCVITIVPPSNACNNVPASIHNQG